MEEKEVETILHKLITMMSYLSLIIVLVVPVLVVLAAGGGSGHNKNQPASNPYQGTKIGNVTVIGAMILTDPMVAEVLGRDFNRVPQGVNGSAAQNANWRIENGKNTAKQLPFHVDFW